jgi:hypothetical protein
MGYFQKIDQNLPGWREMNLLRLMRNAFTKTPLNYRLNDKKNIRLRAEVIQCFDLKEQKFPGRGDSNPNRHGSRTNL